MRHISTVITVCATACIGVAFAQNIYKDTDAALKGEWKAPGTAQYCLNALGLYTAPMATGSASLPTPQSAADDAVKELLKGAADSAAEARLKDLLEVAKKQPYFLDLLATATTLDTSAGHEDERFKAVDPVIGTIYATPPGKRSLAEVQALSAQKLGHLAIFKLLDAYPKSADQPYADSLEILRTCYKMNADRLFKRVSDLILAKE